MTTAVRRRRGTTAQHATFTGLEGEISIDTTKDTVVVHDGTTAGGHPLAKENNTALTGNVTVTTNSTSPALTITQDGTGNALEVRDVTGDSAPFVVDASGNVGVNISTPTTSFQIGSLGTANATHQGRIKLEDACNSLNLTGGLEFKASNFGAGYGWKINAIDSSGVHLVFGSRQNSATWTEYMRIDSSGNVGIGGSAGASNKVDVGGTLPTSSAYSEAVRVNGTVPSGSTSNASMFISFPSTQAASFTLTSLYHFRALQNTIGAGSSVTNQYGFVAGSTLTGAANNFGFYSDIASGTGRWNFYAAGTADNYFGGNVRVGGGGTLGYGTGSGGTVTQATSKSTSVTLNKPSGQITMHNAALAAGASVTFTLTNSTILATDAIVLSGVSGASSYVFDTLSCAAGSALLRVTNITGGSLSEAVVINFCVLKGSLS